MCVLAGRVRYLFFIPAGSWLMSVWVVSFFSLWSSFVTSKTLPHDKFDVKPSAGTSDTSVHGAVCTYPVETCKTTHTSNWGPRHVVGAGAAVNHRKGMSGNVLLKQDDAVDNSLTNS